MASTLNTLLYPTLLVATLFVYSVPVTASQRLVDLSQSFVEFKVKVLGFMLVTGRFHDVHGSIADSSLKDDLELDITVAVESMDTRNSLRDDLLRGPAFFDAERFPTIRFSHARLKDCEDGRKQLVGNLTLRGITQPVVFELTPPEPEHKPGETLWGDHAAYTTIRRTDFGLDGFGASVSNEVEIMVYVKDSDL